MSKPNDLLMQARLALTSPPDSVGALSGHELADVAAKVIAASPGGCESSLRESCGRLGALLKQRRRAAGLKQTDIAHRICYSRSTVANVEIGRQTASRDFWLRADEQLGATGELLASFDRLDEQRRALRASHVELPARLLGVGASDPMPYTVGGLTLSIDVTDAGGLRVRIEAARLDLPAVDVVADAVGGARVYSIATARRARASRPT